ncbi:MAG TPA: hypothetical protein VIU40_12045 [Geobacteraceae bacterium]
MATQLTLVLGLGTTTQCSIFSTPDKNGHSFRLGSIVWLADTRHIGYFNPKGCYPICKHQGPERRPIPCPETLAQVFPTPGEAIAFVAKQHKFEAPFTFTIPAEYGTLGIKVFKAKPTPAWEPEYEPTPISKKRIAPKPKAAPVKGATIEEMVAKATELIKEEMK